MQRPRRTAQFTFHFLSISPTSIDQKIFLPANIELRRRHLKGRATIRISFNSNDFSLSIQATRAVVGEFSMSSRRHISMSCRDYACWRNNFQIMQILGVLREPAVHPFYCSPSQHSWEMVLLKQILKTVKRKRN